MPRHRAGKGLDTMVSMRFAGRYCVRTKSGCTVSSLHTRIKESARISSESQEYLKNPGKEYQ